MIECGVKLFLVVVCSPIASAWGSFLCCFFFLIATGVLSGHPNADESSIYDVGAVAALLNFKLWTESHARHSYARRFLRTLFAITTSICKDVTLNAW